MIESEALEDQPVEGGENESEETQAITEEEVDLVEAETETNENIDENVEPGPLDDANEEAAVAEEQANEGLAA